jgi:putative redox protein
MMPTVTLSWQEGLYFLGDTASGHTVPLEAGSRVGGKGRGVMPGEALLLALGGCTAMDIVSLLNKFDAPPDGLRVELEGDRHEEHPKSYRRITVIYYLDGPITPEQAWKAVRSSYQKYSVVANSLCPEKDYRVILNGSEISGEK